MNRLARATWLLALVLVALPGPSSAEKASRTAPASTATSAADSAIDVHFQADKLSVTSTAPLGDVLARVHQVTGITISFETELEPATQQQVTSLAFESLSLEEAFRRILRNNNFILVYSGTSVREVKIYGDGPPGRPALAGMPAATPARPRLAQKLLERSRSAPPAPAPQVTQDADEPSPAALRSTALGDPEPEKRIDALAQLSDDAARDTALEMLGSERDPDVLETVLDVLRGQESVPVDALVRFAGIAPTPELRTQAITIMGEQGQRTSQMLSFLRRATTDSDEDVRETAKRVLEDLEDN